MEILNNIWLAISNPNIQLVKVISIPILLIEIILTMHLFLSIMNLSSNRKQRILYVFISWGIGILTMFIIPHPFNIFINYFMTILLQLIIFANPLLKSVISSVLSLVIYNLINILIINPFITIFNIDSNQLNSVLIYKLCYLIIIYLITIICIIVLKRKNLIFQFSDNIDKKNKLIIISNLLSGVLAIIIQSITLFYYVDKLPVIITFLSFISLFTYFAISIYSLTRILKLILTTQKLESAEEYNRSLCILHDNVRAFKHDFDNIVTTIGGYIKTNDMKGLKDYYVQLEDDCQRVNNLYLLNPEVINNDGIYNLLTKKYKEAEAKDIKVNMTFLLDLSTLHMKIYEFARILGILLDNAIEASSECDNKIINIDFRNDHKNSRQVITIENTYNNTNIDTERIFEKGITGKENHSGLGLWEVRKLIKKNSNVNLFTSKTDEYFSQQLEIYYEHRWKLKIFTLGTNIN